MAKTPDELFATFAARVAELLRERHDMDPEPLIRTRPATFSIEGLIRRPDGSSEWYGTRATPENLEWEGPDSVAEAFVADYVAAFRAAHGT